MSTRVSDPEILKRARKYRAQIVARSDKQLAELTAKYADAAADVRRRLDSYLGQLAEEAARLGVSIEDVAKVNPSWILQARRLERLVDDLETRIARNLGDISEEVISAQRLAIRSGIADARRMIEDGYLDRIPADQRALLDQARGAFAQNYSTIPEGAFSTLVGLTGDGSPLKAIFYEAALGRGEEFRQILLNGFMAGLGPREISRSIARTLGSDAARTLRIVRTETIRAYRIAQAETYGANENLVSGWIWLSALDRRTCLGCIEKHGQRFPPKEVLSDHPNGRCTMAPDTLPWAEAFPDNPELHDLPEIGGRVERGDEWLRRQSPADQISIMGRARYEAYTKGSSLSDLTTTRTNPIWGDSVGPKPIRDIPRGGERLQEAAAAARRGEPVIPSVTGPDLPIETPAWIEQVNALKDSKVLDLEHARSIGRIVKGEIEGRVGSVYTPRTPAQTAELEEEISTIRTSLLEAEADNPDYPQWLEQNPGRSPEIWAGQHSLKTREINILRERLAIREKYLGNFETEEIAEYRRIVLEKRDAWIRANIEYDALPNSRKTAERAKAANQILAESKVAIRRYNALRERLSEEYERAYREVMAEIRELGGVQINFAEGGASVRNAAVQSALEDVSEIYPRSMIEAGNRQTLRTGKIPSNKNTAGQYSGGPQPKITINYAEGMDPRSTAIHEFGHRIDDSYRPMYLTDSATGEILERGNSYSELREASRMLPDRAAEKMRELGISEETVQRFLSGEARFTPGPRIKDLERDFLLDRAGNEPTEQLAGYSKGTYGRTDELADDYMGRLYARGAARPTIETSHEIGYEVFTMGMQGVTGNAYGMFTRDPDSIEFILGILAAL